MAKYIVESSKVEKFEKNYKFLLINAIPAIVWSVPVHQKLFPNLEGGAVWGICAAFVIAYVIVGMIPFIAVVPDAASVIMLTAMVWSIVDFIGNDIVRIIIKVLVAAFFGMMGLTLLINATLPWLQKKFAPKPRVRKIEE